MGTLLIRLFLHNRTPTELLFIFCWSVELSRGTGIGWLHCRVLKDSSRFRLCRLWHPTNAKLECRGRTISSTQSSDMINSASLLCGFIKHYCDVSSDSWPTKRTVKGENGKPGGRGWPRRQISGSAPSSSATSARVAPSEQLARGQQVRIGFNRGTPGLATAAAHPLSQAGHERRGLRQIPNKCYTGSLKAHRGRRKCLTEAL